MSGCLGTADTTTAYARAFGKTQSCKFRCCTCHNDAGHNNTVQTSSDSLQNVANFKHRGSIPTDQNCIRACLLPYTSDFSVPPSAIRNVKVEKKRKKKKRKEKKRKEEERKGKKRRGKKRKGKKRKEKERK